MTPEDDVIPVIEIGGTHTTAALVATVDSPPVVIEQHRLSLDSHASASHLVDTFNTAAKQLRLEYPHRWGVAIPGPFDYKNGIGRFQEVAKFESLYGFDLKAALSDTLMPRPICVEFLNDADAFGLGECIAGAGRDHDRAICLTLGTGVGSAFIANGSAVNSGPTVPRDGSAHLLDIAGFPLEETVSRRAIQRQYHRHTGEWLDVHTIAQRRRLGDHNALAVLKDTFSALGEAIGPWALSFGATIIVVGGSISGSWDLLESPLRSGLIRADRHLEALELRAAEIPDDAPLIGAAIFAASRAPVG